MVKHLCYPLYLTPLVATLKCHIRHLLSAGDKNIKCNIRTLFHLLRKLTPQISNKYVAVSNYFPHVYNRTPTIRIYYSKLINSDFIAHCHLPAGMAIADFTAYCSKIHGLEVRFVATRLMLPATDTSHLGHWYVAPLPVLPSTTVLNSITQSITIPVILQKIYFFQSLTQRQFPAYCTIFNKYRNLGYSNFKNLNIILHEE